MTVMTLKHADQSPPDAPPSPADRALLETIPGSAEAWSKAFDYGRLIVALKLQDAIGATVHKVVLPPSSSRRRRYCHGIYLQSHDGSPIDGPRLKRRLARKRAELERMAAQSAQERRAPVPAVFVPAAVT